MGKLMLKGHSWRFSKLFQKKIHKKLDFFEFSNTGIFISKNDLFSPFSSGIPENFYDVMMKLVFPVISRFQKKKKKKKGAILPLISKIGGLDKMSTFYTIFREFP